MQEREMDTKKVMMMRIGHNDVAFSKSVFRFFAEMLVIKPNGN